MDLRQAPRRFVRSLGRLSVTMMGLAAAGVGAGSLGALLIMLPAVIVPSMLMVAPALGWRVTLAAVAGVAVTGFGAAALLAAISDVGDR